MVWLQTGKELRVQGSEKEQEIQESLFHGGSVNPGGGMPMVILCGQKVADRIAKADRGNLAPSG